MHGKFITTTRAIEKVLPLSFRGPVNIPQFQAGRCFRRWTMFSGQTKTLKLSEKQYFSSVNKTNSKPCVHCDWVEEALGTPFFVPSTMTDEMLDLRLKATIDCCRGLPERNPLEREEK